MFERFLSKVDRTRVANHAPPAMRWILAGAVASLAMEASGVGMAPFRAWLVGAHEFFHALAGWLTGASVESIRVDSMHGLTMTRGGWYPFISCAGYLGSGAFGAFCLRYCARESMRIVFMAFCACLAAALAIKGNSGGEYGAGIFIAGALDILALWAAKSRFAPFVLAFSGCLFMSLGFEDARVLLVYATSETDAGLLARWLGLPILAWPIALTYCAAMGAMWFWAAKGALKDSIG